MTATATSELKKRRHRIDIRNEAGHLEQSHLVPVSWAKTKVVLERIKEDAHNGMRGHMWACMNVQCGLRLADRFPHPVFGIEFTPSRVFVIDKVFKNGVPAHCVEYYHKGDADQAEFDRGKAAFIGSGKVNKTLILYPASHGKIHYPTRYRKTRTDKSMTTSEIGGSPGSFATTSEVSENSETGTAVEKIAGPSSKQPKPRSWTRLLRAGIIKGR